MAELERLSADCSEDIALYIVFVVLPETQPTWERSRLVTATRRLPEARVCIDFGGAEATRFHATTSGETRFYTTDGRLLFHGGITVSRGHEGSNVNLDRLRAAIAGRSDELHTAPVYGCPLLN